MQARRDPYRGGAGDQYRGHGCPRKHGAAQALLEANVPIGAARYLRIFNPSWIAMLRGTSRPLGAELSQLGRLSK
ncbi:MAG: hypothetical protein CMJ70_14930 [Planctomycetaceae bacterium]|nr:hypothetical protein [Planctomycetaceae bacterium]